MFSRTKRAEESDTSARLGKKHRICWEGKPLGETDDCNRSNLSVRPSVSDVITSRGCPVISNTPTL